MLRFLTFLFLLATMAWAAKPMEPLTNYNVILVHGAADGVSNGFSCDEEDARKEPYDFYREYKANPVNVGTIEASPWQLGGAPGMIGSYTNSNKLTHWLDIQIFENSSLDLQKRLDSTRIYLQRSFTKPAGSPRENGLEIGYSKWACGKRRSLIEEAQEVRAQGRDNLKEYRNDVSKRNKLPPSRNILIAHSMGGVTSREYVQGNNYNNDVDKVITLDSPHEGTGALNMLLGMSDAADHSIQTVTSSLAGLATTGLILAATSKDVTAATVALYGFILPTGMNATTYALGQGLIKFLDKHYQRDDPLTPYIDPTRSNSSQDGIVNLKNRQYTDNLPMMRLLYGENSMTFSEPNDAKATSGHNVFLPKAFNSFFYNLDSQVSGGGSLTVDFINSVTSAIAGALFGVIIGDHGTTLIPQESGEAKNTKAFDDHRANVIKRSYDGHIYKGLDKAIETIPVVMAGTAAAIVAVDKMLFLSPYVGEAVKTGIAIAAGLAVATEIGLAFTAGINDLAGSHEAPLLREYQEKWRAEKNTFSTISGDPGEYKPYRMEEFLYEKPFINLRVTSTNDKLKEPLNTNLGFNYLEVQKDNQNSV
jgi:hypothetical protein